MMVSFTFPGGLPIVDEDGVLVGAIGASGKRSSRIDHAGGRGRREGARRERVALRTPGEPGIFGGRVTAQLASLRWPVQRSDRVSR